MKRRSTLFLKIVIFLVGLIVLTLCLLVLPAGILSEETGAYRPLFMAMYIPAIPFFIALNQAMNLLTLVEKNKVFSIASLKALKFIKYSAFAICALYALYMPYIFYLADMDDAPGLALIGFIFIFSSLAIGTAAAIFQNVLKKAVEIKSENELTV